LIDPTNPHNPGMFSRVILLVGALLALALPATAQVRDTAAIIQQLQEEVQSGRMTPEQLQALMQTYGISREEVRQRLREAGYPEDLLDQYLAGAAPGATPSLTPTQLQEILQRLSIPSLGADSLLAADTLVLDSLLLDTLRVPGITELQIFGRSLFERATSQFMPVTMGPVPPNYQLGPGDELVLILTGDVEAIYTLPVTREGFVVVPDVGRVAVNGLTLDQLRNSLFTYLGRVYSGVRRGPEATTSFEVSIGSLRRNQVFVIGEVERPAQYEVTSVSTALDALYQSGGPNEHGSFRNVQVRRGDRVMAVLDIYEYLTRGAATGDVTLNQGDVVFVPVRGRRVEIDGNVVRPGVYELKGDEGLRALLELSGGIEPEADLRRVQVDRVLPLEARQPGVQRSLFDVNVALLLDGEGEFVALEPGDKVYVFAVAEERRNTVTVRGNVWAPGVYGHEPGLRFSELIERAGGLRDDTYLGRAQIIRLDPVDLTRRVVPVSLLADDDPELDEYDEVVVYSVAEMRDERFVTIHGAVRNPGVYEFRENITIRDLVLMAGGLRDDAYLDEVEVARIAIQPDRPGDLTETISVPIDSSLAAGSDGNRAAAASDFVLERYDNVFIRSQPGFEEGWTVAITGEVRFPGAYALQRKGEGLRELVERAGGLTAEAFREGVRFFRLQEVIGDPEPRVTRVNVDLVDVLEYPSERNAMVLADGDSVHIPQYDGTVYIDGAVLYPTSVRYEPGQGLDYYIKSAGGYARDADKGRTRVEFANGSVKLPSRFLIFLSKPKPGPGSHVFVPAKPPPPESGFDFRSLVAVLTALTTMVIVIARN
jgi:protein involved in polysaccharide export with SLBB domain